MLMKAQEQTLNFFEVENLNKERLPTNTLSRHHRVQRWANFIAGYSVQLVEECLSTRNRDDLVVDPFLGCGTTLVTAKNLGFRGYGYDRHPVFFTLAKAKLQNYVSDDLHKVKLHLLNCASGIKWSEDAKKFLRKLFSDSDLEKISRASLALETLEPRLQPLGTALFLKSCEASCGAQTDGIYKAPTSKKTHVPFEDAVTSVFNIFSEDINSDWYKNHWSKQPDSSCYNRCSTNLEEMGDESVGVCVTSPPYLNNFDYGEMTRMHLYLLGWAGSWREISDNIRNDLITNTTTALRGKKTQENQQARRSSLPAVLLDELDEINARLKIERKSRAGKKEYDYLIYPYYSEIQSVLSELYRVFKTGADLHWIVADAALYGVHIKTHLHTATIMEAIGFDDVEVEFIRRRGHRWVLNKRDGAKEGLGEYHIRATKG